MTSMVITNFIDYSSGNLFSGFIILFLMFSFLFIILEKVYGYILRKKNVEVGFFSYLLGAGIVATINTFMNL